ncbi:MAG: hypothetical protein ACKOXK_10725 [Chakrabartia sp.]
MRLFVATALLASSTVALAQTAPSPQSDPAPATAAPAPAPVARSLPSSTLVSVTPDAEISSKRVEVGQHVSFSVVNDILDNGVVVIPRGSRVDAVISWKTGKAVGGKSGKFEVTFEKVNVRGREYAMRGVHRQEGKGNTVAAVFATWLVSGRSAVMQPGQFVNAFTAENIPY